MHIELRIEADSMEELAPFFQVKSPLANYVERQRDKNAPTQERTVMNAEAARQRDVQEPGGEPATEEAAVEPTPKKTRTRKAETANPATSEAGNGSNGSEDESASSTSTTATTAASPSEVSLKDIKDKASQLMDAGKATGQDIQKLLVDKFDGARAFGQLKPEQYADVLGELSSLG